MSSIQERLQLKRVPLDTWNIREQLCLASAVVRSGDQNWMSVSRALKTVGEPNRPPDWYSQKSCAAQYGSMLEHVETPKRKKRSSEGAVETPQESILKRLTQERIVEIQKTIAEMNQQYDQIKNEIMEARNPSTNEDRLRELWTGIEAARRARERENARRAAWLKEREERRSRAERTWRPPSVTPPATPTSVPPASPLLTSLLKSSPVVTTPQHIPHPATVVETVSPSAGAPTLSMLLEKCGNGAPHDTKHAAIEHIKSQLVQIEQQLKANTSTASPVPLPPAPAPAVDIDDIEIKAEDVYAFRDIDIHIPPVTAMHKGNARSVEKPTFIKKDELEIVNPVVMEPVKEQLAEEDIKQETPDTETVTQEILTADVEAPSEQTPTVETPSPPDEITQPEVKISFPEVKFPTLEIKVIQPEDQQIKEEIKEPEVVPPEPEIEHEEEINVEEISTEVVEEESVQQSEVATETTVEETAELPPEDLPPSETTVEEQQTQSNVDSQPAPEPGNIPLPPDPSPENERKEEEAATEPPLPPPEPEVPQHQETEPEVKVEREADVPEKEEITETEIKIEDMGDLKKDEDAEDSIPLKEMIKEKEKEETPADNLPGGDNLGGDRPPDLEDAHTETDDDTPMELSREEEKDGKKKKDYSRKKKSDSRTCSGSESAAEASAPDSPSASDAERQHRLWKKSVMLVYSRLCAHKYASLFLRPITDEEAPGYSLAVRRPMDLTTIKKNIEAGFIRTTAQFQRDVLLMLANALMYNSSEHSVYQMAKEMHEEATCQLGMLLAAQAHAGLAECAPPRRKRRRAHSPHTPHTPAAKRLHH